MRVQFGTHTADFTITECCDENGYGVIGGACPCRHEVIYGTAVVAGDTNAGRAGRVPGVTDEAITKASAGARRAHSILTGTEEGA